MAESTYKHTSGEWKCGRADMVSEDLGGTRFKAVYADAYKSGSPCAVARAVDEQRGMPDEELLANARLIAAAPKMLKAIEPIVARLKEVRACTPKSARFASFQIDTELGEALAAILAEIEG